MTAYPTVDHPDHRLEILHHILVAETHNLQPLPTEEKPPPLKKGD